MSADLSARAAELRDLQQLYADAVRGLDRRAVQRITPLLEATYVLVAYLSAPACRERSERLPAAREGWARALVIAAGEGWARMGPDRQRTLFSALA